MALFDVTRSDLQAQTLAFYRRRFPNRATHPESTLGKLALATADAILGLIKAAQRVDRDALPQESSSKDAIAAWLWVFTDAGYLPPRAATGGIIAVKGTIGTVIPSGSQLVSSDGVTLIETTEAATLADDGSGTNGTAEILVKAVSPGTSANLGAGSVLTWQPTIASVDGTAQLTSSLAGGTDGETQSEGLARLLNRLQNPPGGGTVHDWEQWTDAADDDLDPSDLIAKGWVYPHRNGTGTVDIVIGQEGRGKARADFPDGFVDGVEAQIDTVRPVTTAGRRVMAPFLTGGDEESPHGLRVHSRVVARPGYEWDWDSTDDTYTVTAADRSAGTVVFSAVPPTLLSRRPDPSVQFVPASNAYPLPYGGPVISPMRITGWNAVTKTATFTIPVSNDFFPSVGDHIYAGGPIATFAAETQLAYIDSLGPSLQSGYADPGDWSDTVQVDRLTCLALGARDAGERPMVLSIVREAGVPQVKIAAPGLGYAAADYQASDDGVNPPELAWAELVQVTD